MEAIAPQAGLPEFLRQREAGGDLRLRGMESRIEARDLGQVGSNVCSASIGATLCGWCNGASGISDASSFRIAPSTRTGVENRVPPCTTR